MTQYIAFAHRLLFYVFPSFLSLKERDKTHTMQRQGKKYISNLESPLVLYNSFYVW